MYLKQLYRYRGPYFLLVVLFIAGQLFINIKRGMVLSPFYHYGMYSQVMLPQKQYNVFEIWVNGSRLQGQHFTPWQWDQVLQPLVYYANLPANNSFYYNEADRLLKKLRVTADSSDFLQACNYPEFESWYKAYLAKVLKQPVRQLQVLYRTYQNTNGTLQSTPHAQPLSALCR